MVEWDVRCAKNAFWLIHADLDDAEEEGSGSVKYFSHSILHLHIQAGLKRYKYIYMRLDTHQ